MDLSPKKMVLTVAAALGIVLGAAGVTAAATDTTSTTSPGASTSGPSGAKATDKVIREHPYQSIGVAFGIGVLIGVLVTRK